MNRSFDFTPFRSGWQTLSLTLHTPPLSLLRRGKVLFYRSLELARLLIHAGFKPALRSLGEEGVHVYQNVAGEIDFVKIVLYHHILQCFITRLICENM